MKQSHKICSLYLPVLLVRDVDGVSMVRSVGIETLVPWLGTVAGSFLLR